MQYYRFLQKKLSKIPTWLKSRTDFFALSDEDGTSWLYVPLSSEEEAIQKLQASASLLRFEAVELNDYVDWGVQWSLHSPDFKDYRLEIDLGKYTSKQKKLPLLYLNAGPGFGDLSHPTTRLMLAMMSDYLQDKEVLDVGSGSGILSFASILLGAKSACGLEIESDAITHAIENAQLNGLGDKITFLQPDDYHQKPSKDTIILMNMIRVHQRDAWSSLPQLHHLPTTFITSGVLASEKIDYVEECKLRGWRLIEERQQDDWMGFVFEGFIK